MSDDYARLAPLYNTLGMGDFAESITPALINFAHSHDWVGRRAVDLGCGTGASVRWFANHGYNITGIDSSPSMLAVAQQSMKNDGVSFQLLEGDIRSVSDLHDIDFVLALDVLNELNSLRDLEAVFSSIARLLSREKLFVFDLHTIEGLAQRVAASGVVQNSDDLTIIQQNGFDFERQVSISEYMIFQRAGSAWQRQKASRTLRGFPIQVISALLQRAGFGIMALLNTRLEPIDASAMREPRVIFFARKPRPETE